MAKTKTRTKHRLRTKRLNPEEWSRAIKTAQKSLKAPAQSGQRVKLKVSELETRTDLFQPRTFFLGLFELDKEFVKKLEREIGYKGELDPIIVIKLGSQWTVLDGHHRLEAYKNLKREEVACVWFGGNVLEAVDKSVELNSVIKLPLAQSDKFEQAWRRTVLGWPWPRGTAWGSKAQVAALCSVGKGTVAKMRRVVTQYHDNSGGSKLLHERLRGAHIAAVSWGEAHFAYLGLDPQEEADKQKQAARLASQMHRGLGKRLSNDPEVTAHALAIYDPELPAPLQRHLQREIADAGKEEEQQDTLASTGLHDLENKLRTIYLQRDQLEQQRELLDQRAQDVLTELEQRKAAGETPSDATWSQWVAEVTDAEDSSGSEAA